MVSKARVLPLSYQNHFARVLLKRASGRRESREILPMDRDATAGRIDVFDRLRGSLCLEDTVSWSLCEIRFIVLGLIPLSSDTF